MKLPKYLQHLLGTEKYRLVDLAKRSGINASDLSKIVNGKRACGPKAAKFLFDGLDEEHRAQALVLWLQDQIPAQYQYLVHVVRANFSGVVRESAPDMGTIEGSLSVLSQQAEKNDAVRTVLMNMAVAFKDG